jgi:hypothetical protein
VSTRLLFFSVWAVGTVAATSLGWTAVGLVAQGVSTQPKIENLGELAENTTVTPSVANIGQAVAVLNGIPTTELARKSVAAEQTDSAPLEFDPAFSVEGSEDQPAPTIASVAVATTAPLFSVMPADSKPTSTPIRIRPANSPVSAVVPPPDKLGTAAKTATTQTTPTQKASATKGFDPARAGAATARLAAASADQLSQPEIHANPGNAFATSPPTTAKANRLRPPKPVSKATKPTRPPIPLASAPIVATPIVQSAQIDSVGEQLPTVSATTPVPLPALVPEPIELPSVIVINTPPVPVSPAVGVTIPAPAILVTNVVPTVPTPAATPAANPSTPASPASPAAAPISATVPTATPKPVLTTTAPVTTIKPAAVVQAYQLTLGSVGVHCAGNQIVLDFATPSSGTSVKVENSGPEEVKLVFRTSGDGDSDRSHNEFSARCRGGVPTRGSN